MSSFQGHTIHFVDDFRECKATIFTSTLKKEAFRVNGKKLGERWSDLREVASMRHRCLSSVARLVEVRRAKRLSRTMDVDGP